MTIPVLWTSASLILGACQRSVSDEGLSPPNVRSTGEEATYAEASPEAGSRRQASLLGDEAANPTAPRAAQANPGAVAGMDGSTGGHRIADLLDSKKGHEATSVYRRFVARACGSGGRDAPPEARGGLRVSGDGSSPGIRPCSASALPPTALASGSFLQPDADEVLLEVASGEDAASRAHALAILRRIANEYELIEQIRVGSSFRAVARLVRPGARDILLICEDSGQMGLYPSRCGFLGRGSFSRTAPSRSEMDDEFDLLRVTLCGTGVSVQLGGIRQHEEHVSVQLVVSEFVREPGGKDERAAETYCTKERLKSQQPFTLDYDVSVGVAHRITRMPAHVERALRIR